MNIVAATKSYEAWARARIPLLKVDLRHKHETMAAAAFPFLRGSFYRWVQRYPEICPDLADTPSVLAVGDLHIENFGTWRDAEGRLLWGVNDFDEAIRLPYANDLVRLAVSALLAIDEDRLAIGKTDACAAILAGYGEGIAAGEAIPFVLEEKNAELRAMASGKQRSPVRFWGKLTGLRPVAAPKPVAQLLKAELPDTARFERFAHRIAGIGSLGRERYLALARDEGGWIAREAKRTLPSAYCWAHGMAEPRPHIAEIAAHAALASDPFLRIGEDWLLRRLGPHCSRIELEDFPKRRDERIILGAMGRETANIHLGSAAAAKVKRDIERRTNREPRWLLAAARAMAEDTVADWRQWRRHRRR